MRRDTRDQIRDFREARMTSVPTPIPSRTQFVLDAIKHRILTGQLTPGQALVETDLAAQFGVSKTPVREALKTLAGTGLVVMSRYKGVTVRMVDADMAREVYDVRQPPPAHGRGSRAPHAADLPRRLRAPRPPPTHQPPGPVPRDERTALHVSSYRSLPGRRAGARRGSRRAPHPGAG